MLGRPTQGARRAGLAGRAGPGCDDARHLALAVTEPGRVWCDVGATFMSRPCLGREVNLAPTGWVHRCAVGAIFRSRPCSRLPQEALLLCRSDLQIATC